MNSDDVRRLALEMSGVTEEPHHGFPSFRVGGKIIATLPDEGYANVMLREDAIREAVAVHDACEEQWWGKRLTAVRVRLADVDEAVLAELLAGAWRRRAPAKLRKET